MESGGFWGVFGLGLGGADGLEEYVHLGSVGGIGREGIAGGPGSTLAFTFTLIP